MIIRAIATLGVVSTMALATTSQAQAYKLHYWQDGTVSWMCNDGITVGVMDDGSEPPEEVVIAACASYGGMAVSNEGGNGTSATVERHASPAPASVKKAAPAMKRMAPALLAPR